MRKTKQQLQYSVELCKNNIETIDHNIAELEVAKDAEQSAASQAENVITNIDKLLTVKPDSDNSEEHS